MSIFSVKPQALLTRANELDGCAGHLMGYKNDIGNVRTSLDPALLEMAPALESVEMNVDSSSNRLSKYSSDLITISGHYSKAEQAILDNAAKSSQNQSKMTFAAAVPAPVAGATRTNQGTGGSANNSGYDPETEAFIKSMMETYGFTEEEAALLAEAYEKINKFIDQQEMENGYPYTQRERMFQFFTYLAQLYPGQLTAASFGLGGSDGASTSSVGVLEMAGVDGEKLKQILIAQHDRAGDGRDFLHECALLSVMCQSTTREDILNLVNWDECSELAGFKGDVYSGNISMSQMKSDIAAVNMFNRLMNSEDGNVLSVMAEYNAGEANGSINSVDEFLKNYGNGDVQAGYNVVLAKLKKNSPGTNHISKGVSRSDIADAYEQFIKYLQDNMTT